MRTIPRKRWMKQLQRLQMGNRYVQLLKNMVFLMLPYKER